MKKNKKTIAQKLKEKEIHEELKQKKQISSNIDNRTVMINNQNKVSSFVFSTINILKVFVKIIVVICIMILSTIRWDSINK